MKKINLALGVIIAVTAVVAIVLLAKENIEKFSAIINSCKEEPKEEQPEEPKEPKEEQPEEPKEPKEEQPEEPKEEDIQSYEPSGLSELSDEPILKIFDYSKEDKKNTEKLYEDVKFDPKPVDIWE